MAQRISTLKPSQAQDVLDGRCVPCEGNRDYQAFIDLWKDADAE